MVGLFPPIHSLKPRLRMKGFVAYLFDFLYA